MTDHSHTPTDDEGTSEQQEEQRRGDRDADHEEQQTDDRATAGGFCVGGGHASSMPQATSDGKRVISLTPTDDEREALYLIEQAESFREQARPNVEGFPNSMIGLWMRTASALESSLRRTEVPEPSGGHHVDHQDDEMTREPDHHGIDPEPQGEPSDAQVEAAKKSLQGTMLSFAVSYEDAARLALRAAGGVR